MYTYFILWIIIKYHVNNFVAQILLALPLGTLSDWLMCPHPLFFEHSTFLLSGPTR